MKKLEIILKIAERCNIDCTYCYVFNGVDESYKIHPKKISLKTIEQLISFLINAVKEQSIEIIQIDFHGGEPLLVGKNDFVKICKTLTKQLENICKLRLCLQTNATLVDEEWIDIFENYNVAVSTSLDGNKEQNDKFRVGFKGEGTYDSTVNGIRKLHNASKLGRIPKIGLLCVINPLNNPEEMYKHFTEDLEFELIDFLLPDCTHDTPPPHKAEEYGEFLIRVFRVWKNDKRQSEVEIRVFKSILSLLLGGNSYVAGYGTIQPNAITVASNGKLFPDDLLRSCGNYIDIKESIFDTSYSEFKGWIKNNLESKSSIYHKDCQNCCWLKVCGGGHPLNRFSSSSEFSNKSVYCDGLKNYYTELTKYLLENGISFEKLIRNLNIEKTTPNTV